MSGNVDSQVERARKLRERIRQAKETVSNRGVGSYQSAAVVSSTFDIILNLLEEVAALHYPQEGECVIET